MIEKLIAIGMRHKLLAVVVTVAVCALGIASMLRLPIDAFPDISPNLVQVFAEVDGMATEEVEQLVTRPTEAAMRSIPGVKLIRSLSSLGLSTVNVYFEDEVDIYRARQLVSERLKTAEESIPEGVDMPHGLEMGPVASGMGKILAYYIDGGGQDLTEIRTLHEWVVKRGLETVPGVAKIVSQGGHLRQYEVQLSPEQLLAHGLTVSDVSEALRLNNANVGAGIVTRGSEELIVRTLGRVGTVEGIGHTVVKTVDGKPVLVSDLGSVELGKAFRRGVALLDGESEVVLGGVYKLHGANSFEVIQSLQARIEVINETLPSGMRIVPYYDQSDLVAGSIRTVRNALLLGLVLISVVAFAFLGNLRNALIMVCSLPFAVLFSLFMMERAGIPGDLISFGGMAIALGMIIDAAIIMVEKLQTTAAAAADGNELKGEHGLLAAAQEVGRPIVFAVAVVAIVFLPIFTLGEIEGKMFRPLAFAVVAAMAGSLIYALLIAPIFFRLMHRVGRPRTATTPGRFLTPCVNRYEAMVRAVLQRRRAVVVAVLLLVGGGVAGFLQLGGEFVPSLQEGTINCYAYMNPNVSLDEISRVCAEISRTGRDIPEIKNIIADIGYGEVGPHMHHTNYGCITITLEPRVFWRRGRSQEEVVALLDERLGDRLGVSIGFSQPIAHEVDGLIAGSGAQVVIKVFGDDMTTLKQLAGKVKHIVADVEGVADLRVEQTDGQTQMQIVLNSEQLARHGLNKHEVQALVHQALTGEVAGEVLEGEIASRILVRLDDRYQTDRASLADLLVLTPSGSHVPLGSLSTTRTVTGLRQISRENTQRYISVQCNVRGRDVGSFVRDARTAVSNAGILPAGYRVDWGGQFELQQAANQRLAVVIPVTLALVVAMLYGLFSSLRLTLLIMLNVPLALVGGILGLAVFGENISIPSSIGFIALFGIALTDGVVLVSRIERLRQGGTDLLEAIVSGCRTKFRPVLMTTLTTALGLLPLITAAGTGSEVQRPLAIVVVFGLATSTVVTLFALPAAYLWIEGRKSPADRDNNTIQTGGE